MGTPQVLTQQIDSTTWQALGLTITVVGLLVSLLVWRRSGAGHGLRAVAWSLVPLVAGLTGLLRLAWEVLDSLLRWATGLVFSPLVWAGVALAVLALVLHVTGSVLVRRSGGRAADRREVGGASRGELAGTPPPATGAPERGASPAAAKPSRKQRKQDEQVVEDQDDIEAILRKHGIS